MGRYPTPRKRVGQSHARADLGWMWDQASSRQSSSRRLPMEFIRSALTLGMPMEAPQRYSSPGGGSDAGGGRSHPEGPLGGPRGSATGRWRRGDGMVGVFQSAAADGFARAGNALLILPAANGRDSLPPHPQARSKNSTSSTPRCSPCRRTRPSAAARSMPRRSFRTCSAPTAPAPSRRSSSLRGRFQRLAAACACWSRARSTALHRWGRCLPATPDPPSTGRSSEGPLRPHRWPRRLGGGGCQGRLGCPKWSGEDSWFGLKRASTGESADVVQLGHGFGHPPLGPILEKSIGATGFKPAT
jgi:hypothetical protein